MSAVLSWAGDDDGLPAQGFAHPSRSRGRRSQPGELPPEVEQALWRGTDLGTQSGPVTPSGFAELDAELPGSGWPCQSVSEVLSPQPSVLEWRIIGPALGVEFQEVVHGRDAAHGRLAVECGVWPMPVVAVHEGLQGGFSLG